jgi:nucleoside-diphosphate-sugar epimerase
MYDEGKRFGEAMTMAYARAGADARIVRIFNTYGPNSDPRDGRLVPNFITQALRGAPMSIYGDGRQTRSLCYVSDLVRGLVQAMAAPVSGEVINLGNPEEHSVEHFARLIKRLTRSASQFEYRAPAVGDDPQRRRPDISRATQLLGWAPVVGLEEGLRRTIDYFRGLDGVAETERTLAGSKAQHRMLNGLSTTVTEAGTVALETARRSP